MSEQRYEPQYAVGDTVRARVTFGEEVTCCITDVLKLRTTAEYTARVVPKTWRGSERWVGFYEDQVLERVPESEVQDGAQAAL